MERHMIREVLAMGAAEEGQDGVFTVLAKIDGIYPYAGWCYVTCHCCSKKAKIAYGMFLCSVCNAQCSYPMVRYRMHLCVSDQTDGTIFTVFNKVGESLLDTAANKFATNLRLGTGEFPPGLISLVGRFFAFRIRLPDYSSEDPDLHTYRVVAMSEIEPTPHLRNI